MGEPSLLPGPVPVSPALRRKGSAKERAAAPSSASTTSTTDPAVSRDSSLEAKESLIELSYHLQSTHQRQDAVSPPSSSRTRPGPPWDSYFGGGSDSNMAGRKEWRRESLEVWFQVRSMLWKEASKREFQDSCTRHAYNLRS